MGIKPFGGIQDDGLWKLTYIHPKDSGGILWQLFVPYKFPDEVDRNAGGGIVNLKRIDHVSLATKDLKAQLAWQAKVFGMEQFSEWTDDHLGYTGAEMSIPGSLLNFEIIQPTRPDSFVQKFIDTRRPGMHHVCCEVESVEAAAAALRAEGIEPFGGIIKSDWKTHTFIHPKDSGGCCSSCSKRGRGRGVAAGCWLSAVGAIALLIPHTFVSNPISPAGRASLAGG